MDLSHVPRAHHQEGDHGRDAVVTPLRVLGYGGIRIWKVWDMEVWDMEGVGYTCTCICMGIRVLYKDGDGGMAR